MELAKHIHACRCAVYAEILRPRVVALTVAAIGAAQIGGSLCGYGMPCMFFRLTGIPCPGCGLTRSIMALLHGNVAQSVLLHPLGPPLLLALVLALIAAVTPAKGRDAFLRCIAFLERKTGFAALGLAMLLVIWGVRLTGLSPLSSLR